MRFPYLAAASACAAVLTIAACSSSSSGPGGSSGSTEPPDGSTVDEAGNVVGPDGEVIDAAVDTKPPSKVVTTTESVTSDGQTRNYELAVPKTYSPAKLYPLILGVHGDGGNGAQMHAVHPIDDVTGDDAIVVYPSGNGSLWDLYTDFDTNLDQLYVAAVINDVKSRFSIDGAKVWGVGYSSGGFVVGQMACRRAGLFTGIVIHAGGAPNEPSQAPPKNDNPDCNGLPTSVMVVHGTGDGTVGVISGQYAASFWAQKTGCSSSRNDTTPAPCQAYDSCPGGSRVQYCEIPSLGHVIWPQALQVEWDFLRSGG